MLLKDHYVLLNVSVVDGYGGYPIENTFVEVREMKSLQSIP